MPTKLLGYLASPYSHPNPMIVEHRFKEVAYMAAQLMARGDHVFSPIAMCHPMAVSSCALPGDFEFWRDFDINMIERCDYLTIMPLSGWTGSKGIKLEVGIAQDFKKLIRVIRMDKEHRFMGYDDYKGECDG